MPKSKKPSRRKSNTDQATPPQALTLANTTAHVAGSLGVPTWVMLNTFPLNYWMLERQDNPWYSSVRLFRQTQPGVWDDVVQRVAAELAKLKRRGRPEA